MTDDKNTEQKEERFDLEAAGKGLFKTLQDVERLREREGGDFDLASLDDALTELWSSVQSEISAMQNLDDDERDMYNKIGDFMQAIQHHIGEIRAERGDEFVTGTVNVGQRIDNVDDTGGLEAFRGRVLESFERLHESKRGRVEKFFTACLNKASEVINKVCAAYKGWQEGLAVAKEEKQQKTFAELSEKFGKKDQPGGAPTLGGDEDKGGE